MCVSVRPQAAETPLKGHAALPCFFPVRAAMEEPAGCTIAQRGKGHSVLWSWLQSNLSNRKLVRGDPVLPHNLHLGPGSPRPARQPPWRGPARLMLPAKEGEKGGKRAGRGRALWCLRDRTTARRLPPAAPALTVRCFFLLLFSTVEISQVAPITIGVFLHSTQQKHTRPTGQKRRQPSQVSPFCGFGCPRPEMQEWFQAGHTTRFPGAL